MLGNVWIDTYVLKYDYDISKMKFQEDKVFDAKWATWKEVDDLVKNDSWFKNQDKRNVKAYYDRWLTPNSFEGITRPEFEKLKKLGLDKIVFDWQTFEEETDCELMGRKGFYTYLMDSLIRARRVGLNVDVYFIPMKPNYRQIPDIMECLEIAGVKNISILNFVPQGRGRENKNALMLDDEELKEFSTILNNARKKYTGNIRIGIPLNGRIAHSYTAGTEKHHYADKFMDLMAV